MFALEIQTLTKQSSKKPLALKKTLADLMEKCVFSPAWYYCSAFFFFLSALGKNNIFFSLALITNYPALGISYTYVFPLSEIVRPLDTGHAVFSHLALITLVTPFPVLTRSPVIHYPALGIGNTFSHPRYPLHVFPHFLLVTCFAALSLVTCFPALTSFPAVVTGHTISHAYIFPVLGTHYTFIALGIGYMFSRAWHWLHVFPHLALVACFLDHVFSSLAPATCFPALFCTDYMFTAHGNGYMLTQCLWLHLFLNLAPVKCFPALFCTGCRMFSRAWHGVICIRWLTFDASCMFSLQVLTNSCNQLRSL